MAIYLGRDKDTGKPVSIPTSAFSTHVHMPGATGKGKTTAILTMLCQLLLSPVDKACHVVVDFLGGLTFDLLLWMASRHCPPAVRDRLVLVKPAREGRIITINPLLYDTLNHGFFKVNRATELILRAWDSQNIGEMPRLGRWLFNSFWPSAQMGLTIADTQHLVMPGSAYHRPLIDALPENLRVEWKELLEARGGEAVRILDSTRNRMRPFYDGVLQGMFASEHNRLDVLRFMREQKIVIICLAPENRLSPQDQSTIAGLVLNEFLAVARSLPKTTRFPTFLWLDEFQRMVTPDIEFAVPEVRQLGIRLILAHQSFSQLKRGNCDLTSLIWQPQTRLIFGEQGDDADLLAHELASLSYNEREIFDEIYTLRQLETGKKLVELRSWGVSEQDAQQWAKTYGNVHGSQESRVRRDSSDDVVRGTSASHSDQFGRSDGGSRSTGHNESTHQQLISELQTIRELARRSYYTFDQKKQMYARDVRKLRTGACLLRKVDCDDINHVQVDPWKPGELAFDIDTVAKHFPELLDSYEKLVEDNFQQDCFVSPAAIEQETRARLERVLRPKIMLTTTPAKENQTMPFTS